MEKFKSSFKSLQAAMASIKLQSPTCIQEAKTRSFREAGIYTNIPPAHAASSSSSDLFKLDIGSFHQLPVDILLACLDSHFICNECTTLLSGSSFPNEPSDHLSRDAKASAKRFFFSPTTTKSIMAESKGTELCPSFFEESFTVSIASDDPFYDFRASMEEMVVAHTLRDWQCLQELLYCYLKLRCTLKESLAPLPDSETPNQQSNKSDVTIVSLVLHQRIRNIGKCIAISETFTYFHKLSLITISAAADSVSSLAVVF